VQGIKIWYDISVILYRTDYVIIEEICKTDRYNLFSLLFEHSVTKTKLKVNTLHLVSGQSLHRGKQREAQLIDILSAKSEEEYKYDVWMGDFNSDLVKDDTLKCIFKRFSLNLVD